jgi:hypothetical protein
MSEQQMICCMAAHTGRVRYCRDNTTANKLLRQVEARWRPSDESASVSLETHHMCVMAKKSKKTATKQDQEKEKAQEDDQGSDVEVEDLYNLDQLHPKIKLMITKLIEKNDELEEENEKQEESLQNQEKFLISKLEELKALSERFEKLSIKHDLVTNSSSSMSQLEKDNIDLKAKLDELSCKYNDLQANHVDLKCSHEKLVESHFMLEVAHGVVITSVKSSQPLSHTLTSTPSQLNVSCTNECASQASQSSIEHDSKENIRLKEEVERLKKDVIKLKGKEKPQPSQGNHETMVKKLEKGSNLASSNIQQANHITSNTNTTKSKKYIKRLCYSCGVYGHMSNMCPNKSWADKCEVAEQKPSNKLANQNKNDAPKACVKCNQVGHPSKNCPTFKEARKKAQVATRRCYACNEVGHMIYECPNKRNKHRANQGHVCYACRRKGHLSYDCPNGNSSKPKTFGYDDMLRRVTNGVSTSKVMCSPQTNTTAIWIPKHLLTNSKGPNKSWGPKYA